MRIELDLGNSYVKWRRVAVSVVDRGRVSYAKFPELVAGWKAYCYTDVLYSSVQSELNERLVLNELSLLDVSGRVIKARVARRFAGVQCGYENIEQLGVDRWLVLLAGYQLSKGACCVIDCGSCVTADWVDAAGLHLGGMIWPGFGMLKQSILERTGKVRFDDFQLQADCDLGRSTQDCVGAGILHAYRSSIEAIRRYEERVGSFNYVLTGGDGRVVQTLLPQAVYREDLVLDGLSLLLDC